MSPKRKASSKTMQKSWKETKLPKQIVQKCSTQEEAEEAVGNTENLTIIQTVFNSSCFVFIGTSNSTYKELIQQSINDVPCVIHT